MTRTLYTAALALASAHLFGCASDPLRPVDVAGTYALSFADGQSLPVLLGQTNEGSIFVTAGSLTLTEEGQYSLAVDFEVRSGASDDLIVQTTFQDTGNYDLGNDERIVFLSTIEQGNLVGSASGSRVNVTIDVPDAEGVEVSLSFRR